MTNPEFQRKEREDVSGWDGVGERVRALSQ